MGDFGGLAVECHVQARKALGRLPEPRPRLCFGTSATDAYADHVHPADKPDEIVPASKPSRTAENVAVESRVATIKQRPTSRCFPPVSDMNVSGDSRAGQRAGLQAHPQGGRAECHLYGFGLHSPPCPDTQPKSGRTEETLLSGVSGHSWERRPALRPHWTLRCARKEPGKPRDRHPGPGTPCHSVSFWLAVRVRAPGYRRDDAHRPGEPEGPVPGPPSRYDAKAEVDR